MADAARSSLSAVAAIHATTASLETEKLFDATIDVANPIGFCADKNAHLLSELHSKFVDRCFKGALILRILKVVRAGACCICNSNGSGEATVDVQFLAAVRVFARWDILTGVTVRHVSHLIGGHYEPKEGGPAGAAAATATTTAQAFVVLQPTRGADALAIGQRIAVRVLKAEHPPRQAAVAYGVLLTCERAAPVFRVRGSLDPAAAADLMGLADRVADELALRAEVARARPAELAFFEGLLYAYAAPAGARGAAAAAGALSHRVAAWEGGPEWVGPAPLMALEEGLVAHSLVELVRKAAVAPVSVAGQWSRPLCLHRSSPLVAFAPRVSRAAASATVAAADAVDEPPRVVFAMMLKNILDFLVATRELALEYDDVHHPKYAGLWGMMRMAQIPA